MSQPGLKGPVTSQRAAVTLDATWAYGPGVKRLLERIPHWVTILLGGFGVVGLLAYPLVTVGWTGWSRWVALGVAAICALISFGIPHWHQWKNQQESRLKLDIGIEPGLLPPSFASLDDFIDRWVREERSACLASLTAPITPSTPVLKPAPGDDELLRGVTMKEIILMEKRGGAGETLTDQDEAVLAASRRKLAGLISAVTQPDARSPEQYLNEVEEYLTKCSMQMRRTVEWKYARQAALGFRVTVVNPTDRVFESVQVEIHLPGDVSAIAAGELVEPPDHLPSQPSSFGQPRSLIVRQPESLISVMPRAPKLHRWPRSDNSRSANVEHEPVNVRPRSRVVLAIVHLLPRVAPGSTLDGTWSATATNALGKISGPLTVTVGQDFPIANVLGTLLAGPDATG